MTLMLTQVIRKYSQKYKLNLLECEGGISMQHHDIPAVHLHFSNLELKDLSESFPLCLSVQLLSDISGLSFHIKET